MRKALIAIVVAAGLFAVGAFAADFTLTSDDVASGTDQVDACAESATVDYTTSSPSVGTADYTITSVNISFDDGNDGEVGGACEGATVDASLGLDTSGDDAVDSWSDITCSNVSVGDSSCSVTVPVSQLEEIAVLVSGVEVPTT